jgi:hypothetical protein
LTSRSISRIALDVEARLFANARGRAFRHDTQLAERLGRENFDLKPFLELILLSPDAAHSGRV